MTGFFSEKKNYSLTNVKKKVLVIILPCDGNMTAVYKVQRSDVTFINYSINGLSCKVTEQFDLKKVIKKKT